MNKKHAERCRESLDATARKHGVYKVAKELIENDKFLLWSGASKDHQHHYGDYGLITHTHEVVMSAFKMKEFYKQYDIDSTELFLACLFHDAGKIHDYDRLKHNYDPRYPDPGIVSYSGSKHKRMIHHISRSGIIWSDAAQKDQKIYDKYFEPVLHAILAHHGRREWGSPVYPKSRVAWLLFLCDGMSARMYDADTMDRIS
tara:strand:+ start:3298 stop:3900 length:603 start_codon:yes stop_codon:yes gene_type:complete